MFVNPVSKAQHKHFDLCCVAYLKAEVGLFASTNNHHNVFVQ